MGLGRYLIFLPLIESIVRGRERKWSRKTEAALDASPLAQELRARWRQGKASGAGFSLTTAEQVECERVAREVF